MEKAQDSETLQRDMEFYAHDRKARDKAQRHHRHDLAYSHHRHDRASSNVVGNVAKRYRRARDSRETRLFSKVFFPFSTVGLSRTPVAGVESRRRRDWDRQIELGQHARRVTHLGSLVQGQ